MSELTTEWVQWLADNGIFMEREIASALLKARAGRHNAAVASLTNERVITELRAEVDRLQHILAAGPT